MKDVVIYRSGCEASKKLLKHLTELPIASDLLFYSVDPDPNTKKRNTDLIKILEVNYTPTVYFRGQKLEGKAVFDWLDSVIRHTQSQSQGPQQSLYHEELSGSMRLPTPQVTNARGPPQQGPPPPPVQRQPRMEAPQTMDFYQPAAEGGAMFAEGSVDMFSLNDAMDPSAFTLNVPESTRGGDASMRGDDLLKAAEMMAKERQMDMGKLMQQHR